VCDRYTALNHPDHGQAITEKYSSGLHTNQNSSHVGLAFCAGVLMGQCVVQY